MDAELVMLGTGSAFPESSYNTCFLIRTPEFCWMTDAGGGNEVLRRLRCVGTPVSEISHLFVSHAHTDHILGVVWIIRSVLNSYFSSGRPGPLNIYGNSDVIGAITEICRLTLLESHFRAVPEVVAFHTVTDGQEIRVGSTDIMFFDCGSENVRQTGYRMRFASGMELVCLGDEALKAENRHRAQDADWLLCGAFCLYADRDIFRPYEKHHLTVRDVAVTAGECSVRNLVLYHSQDRNLSERKAAYTAEAAPFYDGTLHVPVDLERIEITGGGK